MTGIVADADLFVLNGAVNLDKGDKLETSTALLFRGAGEMLKIAPVNIVGKPETGGVNLVVLAELLPVGQQPVVLFLLETFGAQTFGLAAAQVKELPLNLGILPAGQAPFFFQIEQCRV